MPYRYRVIIYPNLKIAMSKRALFLALFLGRIPFARAFKVPGDNGVELPPKMRPDIFQQTKVDRNGSPIGSHQRRHRKSGRDAKHWKENAEQFSDPDYLDEVQERFQWRKERKLRMAKARRREAISRRRQKLLGIAGQVSLLTFALLSSPVLVVGAMLLACTLGT